MGRILLFVWRLMPVSMRWRALWVLNAKFSVGVCGVLFDSHGRILLMRHRFWQKGTWGLPGGFMTYGESAEDALVREVREETRLEITGVHVKSVRGGAYCGQLRIELCGSVLSGREREPEQEMVLDPVEILEARFFAPDALPRGVVPEHLDLIARVCGTGECGAGRDAGVEV